MKIIAEWDEDGNFWDYQEGVEPDVFQPDLTPEEALEIFGRAGQ